MKVEKMAGLYRWTSVEDNRSLSSRRDNSRSIAEIPREQCVEVMSVISE